MRRWVVWLLVLLGLVSLAWYYHLLDPFYGVIIQLANQPEAIDAFDDPVSGRIDALLMLVSFFLLTPVVLGIVLLAVIFVLIVVVLICEPVLRAFQLPLWLCVPVVLLGVAWAAYLERALWLPQVIYVLGLVAKAGLVYFSTTAPVPR